MFVSKKCHKRVYLPRLQRIAEGGHALAAVNDLVVDAVGGELPAQLMKAGRAIRTRTIVTVAVGATARGKELGPLLFLVWCGGGKGRMSEPV